MAGLLEPDAALDLALAAVPPATRATLPIGDCLGLVLAANAAASADLPPFDRAMMDGYAVRLADAGSTVEILAEIAAGDGSVREPLAPGRAYPIMTGAPVPSGAEAVVPQEQTRLDGGRVSLPERIRSHANIVPRGPEPLFESDDERSSFVIRLPVHVEAGDEGASHAANQGTKSGPSRDQVALLRKCLSEMTLIEMMAVVGRANRTKFRDQVLVPLLDQGLVEMTVPDKPRSSRQRYRLTAAGRQVLADAEATS